nr:radical SAM protein [uncultured Draconibacterium sp.]
MSLIINHSPDLFNILRICLSAECNISCFYCFNEGYKKKTINLSKNLKKLETILTAHRQLGGQKACVSGGEPLLDPFLEKSCELIERIYENNIHLTTNGTLIKEDLISFLKRAGRINISIPSFNSQKYLKITGHDFLHRVKKNIDYLIENECDVNLNYILIPEVNDSQDELNYLIDFAAKRKLKISILKLFNQDSIKVPKETYFKKTYQALNNYNNDNEVIINHDCPPITLYKLEGIKILIRDFHFDRNYYNNCVDCKFIDTCEEGLCQPRTDEEGNIKSCLFKTKHLKNNQDPFEELKRLKEIYSNGYMRWIKY